VNPRGAQQVKNADPGTLVLSPGRELTVFTQNPFASYKSVSQINGKRPGEPPSVATALSVAPGRERRLSDAGLPRVTTQYGPGVPVWLPLTTRTNWIGGGGGGGGGATPVDPSPLQAAINKVNSSTRVIRPSQRDLQ